MVQHHAQAHVPHEMSKTTALRYLSARMRRRFDGYTQGWSVADAEAVRLLLSELERMRRMQVIQK